MWLLEGAYRVCTGSQHGACRSEEHAGDYAELDLHPSAGPRGRAVSELQDDVQQAAGVDMSDQTYRNSLHKDDLRAWCPVALPVLTARHRAAWLAQIPELSGSPWAHVTAVEGFGEAVKKTLSAWNKCLAFPSTYASVSAFGSFSSLHTIHCCKSWNQHQQIL